ncbi:MULTISPECIES: histidine kinase [Streptomyces]|uniref:histidine kinase n=1 Tax=Streptomyces venezuelae TaxID=54571 RepID=A0A5P2BG66_STRVZ|nr:MULTISPECIES: histidine kinase [Streptomyces]NDZ99159.1 two-component sensor histidine kinase [Streptomyces sp. SID10116]MYY81735.1 two-component sensor histidine kinase [Streptomyces sp. SID335]MYZ12197.1 two-component sensor histidine kinase [Streptomyces sp. SID337]NDZ91373.1 two-component sensor histidine kinase [Streptomyces sp. SID10115]NEB50560.1 two-component sensor histidine kinase [Streptomyces sp. SID339]
MALSLPRPQRVDVQIAAVSLLCGLALWALGLNAQGTRVLGDNWSLLPLFVLAGLELLRSSRPQTSLVIGTFALVFDQFTTGNLASIMMFTDIVYAAVVYGTPAAARRIPLTTGAVTVAMTIGFLAWWQDPQAVLIGVVTGIVSYGPAATGVLVRNHREAAAAAKLRAEQTALLAEMDRVQAVGAERARMARELHDMVANHLSAIAIHSTAALSLDDPKTTQDALAVIRENSVEGLAEMRRLIGILRDQTGDLEPAAAPTLDGLAALVEGARTNGLDVTLEDARPPDGAKLPAPVELAAYRIVQESLTNALKHAAPGLVTVTLAQRPRALTVRVTSPYGDPSGPRAPGSGAGLVGMRERTDLLGGTFEAGPESTPDGKVWSVVATLPVDPADEGAKE